MTLGELVATHRPMTRQIAVEAFYVASAGLVLGFMGPFDTFNTPILIRMGYWLSLSAIGYVLFRTAIAMGWWLTEEFGINRWTGICVALTMASVPMTFVSAFVNNLIWGFNFDWRPHYPELYIRAWVTSFVIVALFLIKFPQWPLALVPDASSAPQADAAESAADTPPSFANRLPADFGRLLALCSEDHYVRAVGQNREMLILMRLRDALAEVSAMPGLQVHRSWWVARDAVARSERDGREARLILVNGRTVPVSRDRVAALREAGLLS